MKWSLKLGKLLGIDVYVHFTFLLLLAFLGFYYWRATQNVDAALRGVAFIVALFGCVVLHELGHALMAGRYGIQTRDITLKALSEGRRDDVVTEGMCRVCETVDEAAPLKSAVEAMHARAYGRSADPRKHQRDAHGQCGDENQRRGQPLATKRKTKPESHMILNQALIIVADLGLLRAYRATENVADRPPHLELIEELKLERAHQKRSDQLSDQAGRFPRGGGAANIPGDLSAGESLDSEAEQSRRLISQLAGRINALLADDDVTRCSMAISGAIHKQLLEAIDPTARAKIGQVLASNLAKTDASELHAHFERPMVPDGRYSREHRKKPG